MTRQTPFGTIEPDQTAGCVYIAVAYRPDRPDTPVIRLYHPQQVHLHLVNIATEDRIEIHDEPNVHVTNSPDIPGGIGIVVLATAPGLHTMAD